MKNIKPRAVITSEKARSHLLKAKSLMDEMRMEIMSHQQNVGQDKMKKEEMSREDNTRREQNQADMNLQMVKKTQ